MPDGLGELSHQGEPGFIEGGLGTGEGNSLKGGRRTWGVCQCQGLVPETRSLPGVTQVTNRPNATLALGNPPELGLNITNHKHLLPTNSASNFTVLRVGPSLSRAATPLSPPGWARRSSKSQRAPKRVPPALQPYNFPLFLLLLWETTGAPLPPQPYISLHCPPPNLPGAPGTRRRWEMSLEGRTSRLGSLDSQDHGCGLVLQSGMRA